MSTSVHKKRLSFKPFLLATLWGVLIATSLLLPGSSLPNSSILSFDKLGHAGIFAVFCFLINLGYSKQRNTTKDKTSSLTISIVYGIVLEAIQYFVPGRSADGYDALANTIGAIIGLTLFSIFNKN